jgi:ATP-dependent helicase HrpA
MERVDAVRLAYRQLLAGLPVTDRAQPAVREIPWMIEELRVSEFAQELGTAYRISPTRVLRAIDDLADAHAVAVG